MPAPRIVVLPGSNRTGSFNRRLEALVVRELRAKGADVVDVDLRDYAMPLYDGDLEAEHGVPEPARRLHALFRTAAGVFIVTPEYNASIPPLTKNTIDWISRVREDGGIPAAFGGPVFALAAASPGGLGGYRGLMALRQSLELGLGASVLPSMVSVARAMEAFDAAGDLLSPAHVQSLERTVAALLAAAEARMPRVPPA
ncbi:NADPH-dependent oxidoreductase [Lysobacter sp. TY2-98]|uniref:NADPH-dependent FMN reductase n=1 Tax=Lysobacter sp. TY2-98 TaxID=2290922 RepID=UPI000E2001B1|nr:NAD(P)H-dependent oxidoreductase [Lysobacter sp. TY2-98]AXK71070.1 NADPH-dependent oxidoreductase [Lysobacter sp. TY2-98]